MLPSSIGRESDLVELLALTACQTAVEMTVLRLVWLASPCRLVSSALASLWFIKDAPTVTLVTQFTANNSDSDKAEALRTAQQELIAAGDNMPTRLLGTVHPHR